MEVAPLCQKCHINKPDTSIKDYTEFICKKCYKKTLYQIQKNQQRAKKRPEIDQIYPNLFLGNQDGATQKQMLQQREIKSILVCGNALQTPFKKAITYKVYQIDDDPKQNISKFFQDSFLWIQKQHNLGKKVLIHCRAGVSRSASFTIAYIMKKYNKRFTQVFQYVKSKRKYISPNYGFRQQLLDYELALSK